MASIRFCVGMLVLGGLFPLAGAVSADFVPGLVQTRVLEWEGASRTYDVYLPAVDVAPEGLPVVLDFHGFGSTKEQQRGLLNLGLQQLSVSERFLLVWPQGTGNAWNAGTCCTFGVDDVGFVRALLDALSLEAPIDASRIYATGLSNGAAMSHRLACDADDLFAAVAPVAFPVPFIPLSGCQPMRPIAVGMVMGLTDTVVPYVGGGFGDARDSLTFWRDENGCGGGEADVVTLLQGEATPLQRCETYTACSEGVEVQLCSVVGAPIGGFEGHLLYFNNSGLDVAAQTWGFMSRFEHPDPPILAPEAGATALRLTAILSLLGLRRVRQHHRITSKG
ncbi:MAG: hypothetical protein VCC67_14715 [Myxococcota bacterium]